MKPIVWLAPLALVCLSCSDQGTDPPNDTPVLPDTSHVLVSEPRTSASAGTIASSNTFAEATAYVSLPPNTLPFAVSVQIRNASTNSSFTPAIRMIEGGFDPIPVEARAGDVLELSIKDLDGIVTSMRTTVPKRKPPGVVRSDPPKGRTDVAINSRAQVIFTEPINRNTLNSGSVRLLRNGQPVSGTVIVSATALSVEFVPAAPLVPLVSYELVVTQDIRDADGDALDALYRATFTTELPLTGRIAFVSDRDSVRDGFGTTHIFVVNADGSELTRVTDGKLVGDGDPAWSPDGRQIAFSRYGYSLWVVNADGSGLHQVGIGTDPAWSPDGIRIAFARIDYTGLSNDTNGIFVMNADGSGVRRLTATAGFDEAPAWSTDGQTIAFDRRASLTATAFTQLYLMNADGTNVRRLTTPQQFSNEIHPTWSPVDGRIAFWSVGYGIATMVPGGAPTSVYRGGLSRATGEDLQLWIDAHPDWSPDARKLLFVKHPDGSQLRNLYLIDVQSREVRPLLPGSEWNDWSPAWSRR